MHELKEELRMIFERTTDWLIALFNLGRWLNSAVKYFPKSRQTIIRWRDEIIAYFDNRTKAWSCRSRSVPQERYYSRTAKRLPIM